MVILLAIVAILDAVTGSELSFSIFYLAPVAIATLRLGRPAGTRIGVVCAIVWTTIDATAHGLHLLEMWNGTVRLGYFLIVSGLLGELAERFDSEATLARVDPLTGLLNRRGFIEAAERELARSRRSGEAVIFAFLDLDDFKTINDSEGHEAGDRTLSEFAGLCVETFRSVDVVGRLGGDEFALCLTGITLEEAEGAIDRLRRVLPLMSQPLSFSLGMVRFLTPPAEVDEALRQVDEAMYLAKSSGRGQSAVVTR